MTPRERAEKLIKEGWRQTSRKYRMLACLPDGMTGKEALYEARMREIGDVNREYWEKEIKRWIDILGENSCADHFRRVYAGRDDSLNMTLDEETFMAFRSLGGGTI